MQTNTALPTNEQNRTEYKTCDAELPEFAVSRVFGDHMVLQRGRPIKIWGFSSREGGKVFGHFGSQSAECTVRGGRFTLEFPAREASFEPQTVRIYDDAGNEKKINDVLTGDVWVIGGQSNGEMNLRFCLPETIPEDYDCDSGLRYFMQTQAYVYTHQQLCSKPQPDVITDEFRWRLPDREASLSFSAIGAYIGRGLNEKLGIPVGMINMSAGGACIRELIPAELASELGYDYGANVPVCGYYNTLIHPFIGLSFTGMVFFQGESEGCVKELADRYDRELIRLVEDEHERFGFDFPFYNVQISSYRNEGEQYFPYLETVRLRQFEAYPRIKNSSIITSMDLGSPDDWGDFAHSPYKKRLCDRIIPLILAKSYGKGDVDAAECPVPVSAVLDGGVVTVRFAHATGGLVSRTGKATGFSFGYQDNVTDADAVITGPDTVAVTVPGGVDASYLNYAYASRITPDDAPLYDGTGLPCPAFRIKTEVRS